MARLAILAVLALLAITASAQSATNQCNDCPPGYVKQTVYSDDPYCDFVCLSPIKLNCMYPLSNPVTCGGYTYKQCPTLACGYTSAYAVSGPAGCASAKSKVQGTAISASSYNLEKYYYGPYETFCKDDLMATTVANTYAAGDYTKINDYEIRAAYTDKIIAKSVAAAKAVSDAVAVTVMNYNSYVCSCCSGNSAAYTVVGEDVQAVAKATASAYVNAMAIVYDSCGYYQNVLAGASQESAAYAQDVQLAIDGIYKQVVGKSYPGKCTADGMYPQIQYAVAKASVCVFAKAYAAVVNKYYENVGEAYNCGTAIAIAGYDTTCKIDYNC